MMLYLTTQMLLLHESLEKGQNAQPAIAIVDDGRVVDQSCCIGVGETRKLDWRWVDFVYLTHTHYVIHSKTHGGEREWQR